MTPPKEESRGGHTWPPAVREFVRERQEDGYRKLAEQLGWNGDPARAFAHLNQGRTPHAGAGDAGPTPYERAEDVRIMEIHFGEIGPLFGSSVPVAPALATLPSGEVNARIMLEPFTEAPILFFEQGLFRFMKDMADLIAWAVPPLPEAQLGSNEALINMSRRYTIPFEATEAWAGAVHAYVASGAPLVPGMQIPPPLHNQDVAVSLVNFMELFVVSHEVGHLALGHFRTEPATREARWAQEYEADAKSVSILTEYVRLRNASWAVCFWGCDLALTCFNMLDRALADMQHGPAPLRWISETHPDSINRRNRLRERVRSLAAGVSPSSFAAAEALRNMTDALLPRVAQLVAMTLALSHGQGTRPSPLWADHMARSFRLSDGAVR